MTITLSQQDHQDLLDESQRRSQSDDTEACDVVVPYPEQLGQGECRMIDLREGVDLFIGDYQLHDNIVTVLPERSHLIEYVFYLTGKGFQPNAIAAGQYALYGSGMAPAEIGGDSADEPILEVNVHIPPAVLKTFWGESFDLAGGGLEHLFRSTEQPYYERLGATTATMRTALHQLLHCPFTGIIKKTYLESKVWELMALLLDQELQRREGKPILNPLKLDDIERIHQAKKILLQRLDNPPSLLSLARQVGLNDCALKRGFRQVFGETTFGYLHNHRMETARQLLIEGEVNITEAARHVGFANRSYFAAAFRKKYGVAPSEYLRQTRKSG
ncbi:MAG: helix-turn-helix transcriptional regulator [Leptolyngbyaceae cyanobacterium]